MVPEKLVEMLVCPETRKPVRLAPPEFVEEINRQIRAGELKNKGGEKVSEPIDAGLLREDGRILYPVRGDIPVMLVDEGIAVGGV